LERCTTTSMRFRKKMQAVRQVNVGAAIGAGAKLG
jgi:hypothetical protein